MARYLSNVTVTGIDRYGYSHQFSEANPHNGKSLPSLQHRHSGCPSCLHADAPTSNCTSGFNNQPTLPPLVWPIYWLCRSCLILGFSC